MRSEPPLPRRELYIVLSAAVLQGWSLYGLHVAMRDNLQITDWTVFPALYVLAVFAPLTAQLLAQHARQRLMWLMVLVLATTFLALAWHQSSLRLAPSPQPWFAERLFLPTGLALTLLWLHLLPFMQARLASGRWRARYPDLFAASWRNVLVLLEASVFTLALWLLLFLWGRLFAMLDIAFFSDLFREPLFAYPVSAIALGLAIHLIGSVDRIVSVVLEQVLSLFKWLGLVAGTILVFFSIALLTRLPTLIDTGTRAIGAGWLLWLIALTVLLVNAAWRDGSSLQPYPRALGNALRFALPLLLLVAITALYSLVIRADNYGLTVQRVWAFVVAAIALAYALGYTIAALRRGPWLASLGSTNVAVALAFIVLMLLFLTPPLSPQRLTASSQYARVLGTYGEQASQEALETLRFETGTYGRAALQRLQRLVDHPRAAGIRSEATRMLALDEKDRWRERKLTPPQQAQARIGALRVFPAGRKLDASLWASLAAPATRWPDARIGLCMNAAHCAGVFANLDGQPGEEFILLGSYLSLVLQLSDGRWNEMDVNLAAIPEARWEATLRALESGDFGVEPAHWLDLRIGTTVLPTSGTTP